MEEVQENIHLRLAEDNLAVLLDCDITADKIDSLVDEISKKLKTLGISGSPDNEQPKEQTEEQSKEQPKEQLNEQLRVQLNEQLKVLLKEQLSSDSEEDPHLVDYVIFKRKYSLRVTENKMAILLDCDVPADSLDSLVEDISKELEALGVKEPPDKEQLKKQLKIQFLHAAEKNLHLADFALIKGKPPTLPRHGRISWSGDFFNTGFVIDEKTGKADYRQKVAHESVEKDELLGQKIPVKEGEDGINALGETIVAEKPIKYYPKTGKNVRFSESDNSYHSEINGRIRLVDDVLYVDAVYTVEKDVNMTTGNISHTGAVVVKRDVLKDSKIEAVGNVEVHGVVESADIKTGGNLIVHGGIILSEGQKIVAEGSINAKFIHGGDIQANKDIVVEREIINSNVRTLGSVIVSRGRVVGGEMVALRGIFIRRSGAKTSTHTVLIAGKNFSIKNKLALKEIKIKRVEKEISELKHLIASFKDHPESDFVDNEEKIAEEKKRISDLEKELQELMEDLEEFKAKALERANKLIVVEEKVYPSTVFCLDDETLTVEKEYTGPLCAKIEEGKIVFPAKKP